MLPAPSRAPLARCRLSILSIYFTLVYPIPAPVQMEPPAGGSSERSGQSVTRGSSLDRFDIDSGVTKHLPESSQRAGSVLQRDA